MCERYSELENQFNWLFVERLLSKFPLLEILLILNLKHCYNVNVTFYFTFIADIDY